MKKNQILVVSAVIALILVFMAGVLLMTSSKAKEKGPLSDRKLNSIYDYAVAQLETKDYDNAVKSLEVIAKEETASETKGKALVKLADLAAEKGDLVKAGELYKNVVDNLPSSDVVSEAQKKLEETNVKLFLSPIITKDSVQYTVKPGDNLTKIAKLNQTTIELIQTSNNLKSDVIVPGKILKIPQGKFSILVDKSQNLLFLKKDQEVFKTYVVATGKDNSTPVGTFVIEEKMVSPTWYKVGAVVSPDSAEYELGTRWMGLSVEGYGIHGTKDPNSIGSQVTKGCVRMKNNEVEELYAIVPSGTEVTIVD